jgi:hypothetical protein|tara:strand:+ start:892 stop:1215 length:324 start_codon:yes stop_codon:yes gene_type:complete
MGFYRTALVFGLMGIGVIACNVSEPVGAYIPQASSYPLTATPTPIAAASSAPMDKNLEALLSSGIQAGWFTSEVFYTKVSQYLMANGELHEKNMTKLQKLLERELEG